MAQIHPSYDFSKFVYAGNAVKGIVVCPSHGEFQMHPNSLSNGQGCKICGRKRSASKRTGTFSDFVRSARAVHGDDYEYVESSWKGRARHVTIRCKKHELEFNQRADAHVNKGSGCPKCANERTSAALLSDQASFISKCVHVHGDAFDLSRVIYAGSHEKIEVVCRIHGSFFPRAGNFINRGSGCPVCASDRISSLRRLSDSEHIASFREVHGDTYAYTEIFHINNKSYVRAVCPQHGEFTQLTHSHKSGHKCSRCSIAVWDTESFIAEALKVHGHRYDYSKTNYSTAHGKVTIGCKTHGDFQQGATYHVNNGHGCPDCGKTITSKAQAEIATYIASFVEIDENYVLPSKKHIDVFIPSLNVGVEYHGLIWHSEKFQTRGMRDYAKHKEAADLGIRIIHVYSDEWMYREHVVKAMLKHVINRTNERVYARQCSVRPVSDAEASYFYEDNHIQGGVSSPCNSIGLNFNGELVAVMSFSRLTSVRGSTNDKSVVELRRFASSMNVVGGASKLLSAFTKSAPEVSTIISYSDNRQFSGGVYVKMGFTKDSVSEPSYSYVNPNVKWREGKQKFTRARMARRQGFSFDPQKSEKENCEANNWYRVYDCGKTKWVWTR